MQQLYAQQAEICKLNILRHSTGFCESKVMKNKMNVVVQSKD